MAELETRGPFDISGQWFRAKSLLTRHYGIKSVDLSEALGIGPPNKGKVVVLPKGSRAASVSDGIQTVSVLRLPPRPHELLVRLEEITGSEPTKAIFPIALATILRAEWGLSRLNDPAKLIPLEHQTIRVAGVYKPYGLTKVPLLDHPQHARQGDPVDLPEGVLGIERRTKTHTDIFYRWNDKSVWLCGHISRTISDPESRPDYYYLFGVIDLDFLEKARNILGGK